jgi:hypothetical protein
MRRKVWRVSPPARGFEGDDETGKCIRASPPPCSIDMFTLRRVLVEAGARARARPPPQAATPFRHPQPAHLLGDRPQGKALRAERADPPPRLAVCPPPSTPSCTRTEPSGAAPIAAPLRGPTPPAAPLLPRAEATTLSPRSSSVLSPHAERLVLPRPHPLSPRPSATSSRGRSRGDRARSRSKQKTRRSTSKQDEPSQTQTLGDRALGLSRSAMPTRRSSRFRRLLNMERHGRL